MALDTNNRKEGLNRVKYSVRVSQLIYQYGPGGMVDFPDQTLMTAAPEYWETEVEHIHDERLEKALHVDYFGVPSGDFEAGHRDGISYVRFPEWYFCPKCRAFKPIGEWVADYRKSSTQETLDRDPYMTRRPVCSTCRQPLVVARIITVCKNGHIDDFPWIEWCHAKSNKTVCSHPKMYLKTAATASEGLEGIEITCGTCQARSTLTGAFNKDAFDILQQTVDAKRPGSYNFTCSGYHPWKHTHEACHCYPRAQQRGSSSVYFPQTITSLVIPPYSALLTKQVEESKGYEESRQSLNTALQSIQLFNPTPEQKQMVIQSQLNQAAQKIATEIGANIESVTGILKRKWTSDNDEDDSALTGFSYRAEEFDALRGAITSGSSDYDGDFRREGMDISKYKLPYLTNISLIHKVRQINALIGFSRLDPVENGFGGDEKDGFVPIKENNTNWYPAEQVRGEGIYLELDEVAIRQWKTAHPEIIERAELLNRNYAQSFFGSQHPRKITAKYILLHTLSHLLIKQLSFECGYGIASLRERIYCGEETDGKELAGILIYTAGGDSEGTLGGLVRQGRPDVFPGIFRKAIESAQICSNDPVCSLSDGQGRDSLNLAACYSCTLIPETSCEDFNEFLDRGMIIGTMKRPDIGFYSTAVKSGWADTGIPEPVTAIPENTDMPVSALTIICDTDSGRQTGNDEWYDAFYEQLYEMTDNPIGKKHIHEFMERYKDFIGKECPYINGIFRAVGQTETYTVDMIWYKSRIMVFTDELSDEYEIAKKSDWHCILCSSDEFNPDNLLGLLKGDM